MVYLLLPLSRSLIVVTHIGAAPLWAWDCMLQVGLRATLSDTRDRVVSLLTPVVGSRLYGRGQQAAGLALDSLAAHHHPPSLLVCDEVVGSFGTGREITFDPAD